MNAACSSQACCPRIWLDRPQLAPWIMDDIAPGPIGKPVASERPWSKDTDPNGTPCSLFGALQAKQAAALSRKLAR
jgi:hypothetical protein